MINDYHFVQHFLFFGTSIIFLKNNTFMPIFQVIAKN